MGTPFALAGVVYAVLQLRQARKATSAGTVLSFMDSFVGAWDAYRLAREPEQRQWAVGNVLNLMESASAVLRDGLLRGHSGKLLRDYIIDCAGIFSHDPAALSIADRLISMPDTFEHLHWFLDRHKLKLGDRRA